MRKKRIIPAVLAVLVLIALAFHLKRSLPVEPTVTPYVPEAKPLPVPASKSSPQTNPTPPTEEKKPFDPHSLKDPKNIRKYFKNTILEREIANYIIGFCQSPNGIFIGEKEIYKDSQKSLIALMAGYRKMPEADNLFCEKSFILETIRGFLEDDAKGANTRAMRSRVKDFLLTNIENAPASKASNCTPAPMSEFSFARYLGLESDTEERTRAANLYLSKCRSQKTKNEVEELLKLYIPNSDYGVQEPVE